MPLAKQVGFAAACVSLLIAPAALALVPEPPHVLHGTVTENGLPLGTGTVSVLLTGETELLAEFELGTHPDVPNAYYLEVPMDAVEPRAPGTARQGDSAQMLVDGAHAADVVIGERGSWQELNLTITTSHALSVVAGPVALPSSLGSGRSARLFISARDNLGHPLACTWSAACRGMPPGSFDDPGSFSPTWTAPVNVSGSPVDCTLTATIGDGQGLSLQRELAIPVAPSIAPLPVAVIAASPNPSACGQGVTFDGTGSYHEDSLRAITEYEWDFDYDGITFTVDATGPSAAHAYPTFGERMAALRVTDDGSPPRAAIATKTVTVQIDNAPPVADAGGPYFSVAGSGITLDGSGSSDPDLGCGDRIESYEWDLDGNGLYGDLSGRQVAMTFSQIKALICGGTCAADVAYPVSLRVTDAFSAADSASSSYATTYLLFADDFSDGTLAGDPDWEEVTGNWKVLGKTNKIFRSVFTKNDRAVCRAPLVTDLASGILEARFRLTTWTRWKPNGSFLFSFQDKKHFRYVRFVRGSRPNVFIGQAGDFAGVTKGIKAWKRVAGLRTKRWYPVRIDLYPDGLVNVYWGGKPDPVISHKFPSAVYGKVGLQADRAMCFFDDFVVWQEEALP